MDDGDMRGPEGPGRKAMRVRGWIQWAVAAACFALAVVAPAAAAYAWDNYLPGTEAARDVVYDPVRSMVYSTKGGAVHRYDVRARSTLAPVALGTSLVGLDIEPDGDHLLVADKVGVGQLGRVHRVDLRSWSSEEITYTLSGSENGGFSIAATSDGGFLLSGSFAGLGHAPLRRWDADDRAWTVLADWLSASSDCGPVLKASADRNTVGIAVSNVSPGTYGYYDVSHGVLNITRGWLVRDVACDATGSRLAFSTSNDVKIVDRSLNELADLDMTDSIGVSHSPVATLLFGIRSDEVVALSAADASRIAGFSCTGLSGSLLVPYDTGRVAHSPDGRIVYVTTSDGIRQIEALPVITFGLISRDAANNTVTLGGSAAMETVGLSQSKVTLQSSSDGVIYTDVVTVRQSAGTFTFTVPSTERRTWYRVLCYGVGRLAGVSRAVSDPGVAVESIRGRDRYDTAVQASKAAFPKGLEPSGRRTVVIATGLGWADALGGTSLAGVLDSPVLLVDRDRVPDVVIAEVRRLGATRAVILGGEGAVGSRVQAQLTSMLGTGSVERIAGRNRYATADLIAARVVSESGPAATGAVLVATGTGFADALAAAPLAAAQGWPVLLAEPTHGLSASGAAIAAGAERAIVLGGQAAVPHATEEMLKAALGSDNVIRIAGPNRYATAAAICDYAVRFCGLKWDRVAVASGVTYPDALAGGVLQGERQSVMLLTSPASLSGPTAAGLAVHRGEIAGLTFVGGDAAVGSAVRRAVLGAFDMSPSGD